MRDSITITFRAPVALQDGLRRAAVADHRSVSSLLVKVLSEWLAANGYAETAKPPRRRPPRNA